MSDVTIVHLLRHGEVENPAGIIYGRLPGYHLSANGRSMASAAADYFAGRPVTALFCSPLERAQETARPWRSGSGLTS
jgi:broad specificity phosphatase PhoE